MSGGIGRERLRSFFFIFREVGRIIHGPRINKRVGLGSLVDWICFGFGY